MWTRLTQDEQDDYYLLIKKIEAWVAYCETCRNHRVDKKKRPLPIDFSRDLSHKEYLRWDELTHAFWNMDH